MTSAEYRQVALGNEEDDDEMMNDNNETNVDAAKTKQKPSRHDPDGHYTSDGSDSEIDVLEEGESFDQDDKPYRVQYRDGPYSDKHEGIEMTMAQDYDHARQLSATTAALGRTTNRGPSKGKSSCCPRWFSSCCSCLARGVAILLILALLAGAGWFLHDYLQVPVHYSCPRHVANDANMTNDTGSSTTTDLPYFQHSKVRNETVFLQEYRHRGHDHWGIDFETYKQRMWDWKTQRFAPYLHDHSTIYESASGLGLNLVMTLEVLKEVQNLTHLIVYGNDYEAESIDTANHLMHHRHFLPGDARPGQFCQADSTQLHQFVPANAFDLVFTGYITPLQDPLEYNYQGAKAIDALWAKYAQICRAQSSRDKARKAQMQQLQEDWYASWVTEMVRIAKPGAPVIVEQVSPSVCTDEEDWGGVDRKFWHPTTLDKYGWDVDPTSIVIQDDATHGPKDDYNQRYHVFMRKNE